MTTPTQKQAERAQYTPGPWRYCMFSDHIPNYSIQPGQSNRKIALVNYYAGDPMQAQVREIAEGEANARLIAAAPELYDSAVTTGHDIAEVNLWLNCPESTPAQKLVGIAALLKRNQSQRNAAIAKAEGRAE